MREPNLVQKKQNDSQLRYKICKVILLALLAIFVAGFIAFSFINLNYNNIERLNYPANSQSKICALEYSNTYPLLFIDLSTSIPHYRCVNQCPSGWNQFIISDSQGKEIYSISKENVNEQMGGVCWSSQKQEILNKKGFYYQINYKYNLIGQFRNILVIIALVFITSLLFLLLFCCLPQSIIFYSSIVGAFLTLGATIVYFSLSDSSQKNILIIAAVVVAVYFLWLVCSSIQKLNQSIKYSNETLKAINQGATVSITVKLSLLLALFNILNFSFLVLVLLQFISLVSSEQQSKSDDQIYFTVQKIWWKYLLLFLQWLIVSNLLKEVYTLLLVKYGYQINLKRSSVECLCLSFNDLLNANAFSFSLILLWLPIKMIELFKPDGAIIRKEEQPTVSHQITKAFYCCCGYFINSLHKYTFNPYLILILDQQQFNDIHRALILVQSTYHRHDDKFDRSSLWIYRLSNYIILIIASIGLMHLFNQHQNSILEHSHTIFFYILTAILSVQVSRFNMNFWGTLVQVREIISLNKI